MAEIERALVGGTIVDPDAGTTYRGDVGISGGRVVALERRPGQLRANEVIDVAGMLVTPGLVDSHAHVYQHVSPGSVDPDRIGVQQAVCAVVDAGSFGPRNADGFDAYIVKRAVTPIFGLVNISRWGVSTNPGEGDVLGFLSPTEAVAAIDRHGSWVKGVKARASNTASGSLGAMSTRLAKQAARECGVPLMVHVGNGPPTLDEVLDVLTAGDLVTHCFHGKVGGIVTRRGELLPSVRAAYDRGVLFDVGHGSASFAWATGERALAIGLTPHVISTDLHAGCINGPAYSLVKTMSKFLHLGMSLIDVVRASSTAPARALGLGDRFGRVAIDAPANLSVIQMVDRTETMADTEKKTRVVQGVLEARYAVVDGRVHRAAADATAPAPVGARA
jgi:dihydroorotase